MNKYYLILEISPGATKEDIKKAFRRLAHIHHPDVNGGRDAKFKEINEAYTILMKDDGSGWSFNSEGSKTRKTDSYTYDWYNPPRRQTDWSTFYSQWNETQNDILRKFKEQQEQQMKQNRLARLDRIFEMLKTEFRNGDFTDSELIERFNKVFYNR